MAPGAAVGSQQYRAPVIHAGNGVGAVIACDVGRVHEGPPARGAVIKSPENHGTVVHPEQRRLAAGIDDVDLVSVNRGIGQAEHLEVLGRGGRGCCAETYAAVIVAHITLEHGGEEAHPVVCVDQHRPEGVGVEGGLHLDGQLVAKGGETKAGDRCGGARWVQVHVLVHGHITELGAVQAVQALGVGLRGAQGAIGHDLCVGDDRINVVVVNAEAGFLLLVHLHLDAGNHRPYRQRAIVRGEVEVTVVVKNDPVIRGHEVGVITKGHIRPTAVALQAAVRIHGAGGNVCSPLVVAPGRVTELDAAAHLVCRGRQGVGIHIVVAVIGDADVGTRGIPAIATGAEPGELIVVQLCIHELLAEEALGDDVVAHHGRVLPELVAVDGAQAGDALHLQVHKVQPVFVGHLHERVRLGRHTCAGLGAEVLLDHEGEPLVVVVVQLPEDGRVDVVQHLGAADQDLRPDIPGVGAEVLAVQVVVGVVALQPVFHVVLVPGVDVGLGLVGFGIELVHAELQVECLYLVFEVLEGVLDVLQGFHQVCIEGVGVEDVEDTGEEAAYLGDLSQCSADQGSCDGAHNKWILRVCKKA